MTIDLEHLSPDDWNAARRNFETLQRLVLDTGGQSMFLRLVAGGITPAGAKNYGTGFTVTRTGVGVYVVVFTKAMPGQAAVQFGSDQGIPLATFATGSTGAGFTANVVTLAGAATDSFINFNAAYLA